MIKPVVNYSALHSDVVVGFGAIITPRNHPGELVSNTGPAFTSPVVCIREDGGFETRNTIYVPEEDDGNAEGEEVQT